jgi:hypothetical protein
VKETEFRSCELNNLCNPPPFIFNNNQITPNPNYNIESTIFKRLAFDDTFHDLSKERSGYNKTTFNSNGPANYLLTGQFFQGDNILFYKNSINYDEFKIPGGSFESNVTKSVEIKRGLQTADITITYDEIIQGFTSQSISEQLKQKLILSGGSVKLCLNLDNPKIKSLKKTNITFSEYMIALSKNEQELKSNYLIIASFVRWFLHSEDMENLQSLTTPNLPTISMKILSDAGISFLGDFFSVEGSNVTPFIGVPCFLDSASTSTSVLDPNLPIYFEELNSELIIPIISNYFSCNEYFVGYLLNEKSTFDLDNLFNFSLIIFKIPQSTDSNISQQEQLLLQAIMFIRNNPSILDENYNHACNLIKTYVDTYPQLVARYYFGEVRKQIKSNPTSDATDELTCGTCGAGVPYIGKIMDLLIPNIPKKAISGQWLATNGDVFRVKNIFNSLKNNGQLNSRIPIADARILKIFCYNTTLPNGTITPFMNMTPTDYLSLFKLIADYKRTGDYQQSYTVLKEIMKNGSNAECFTFCSGDELSTLVARLLGVPSIYQVGATSTCTLYRCNLLNATPEQKAMLEIVNDKKIIDNYLIKITHKLSKMDFFVKNYYLNICQLRQQLFDFLNHIATSYDNIFIVLKLSSAVYILSKLIKESNSIVEFTTNSEFIQKINYFSSTLVELNTHLQQLSTLTNQAEIDSLKTNMHAFLLEISKFEEGNSFGLFNTIIDSGNLSLSLDYNVSFFNPLTQEEITNITFKKDIFGLNIRNGKDVVTKTKKMIEFLGKRFNPQTSSRVSARGLEEKAKQEKIENDLFVREYNDFIESFDTTIFENGLDGDIKISNFESFTTEYVNALLGKVKNILSEEIQNTGCDSQSYSNIINQLSILLTQLKIPVHTGGNPNYLLTQVGGGIEQDDNKKFICNDIFKLVLNLVNKCASYCSNTFKFANNNHCPNLIECIKFVSQNYETDDFCNQLLFEQDDSYSLENENLGFLIGLKMIAEQYTYSDILEPQNIQQPGNIDKILTVNVMLDILNLQYVKLILILLTWSNISNVDLLFNLIGYDTTEIDPSCKDNFIQNCFNHYIQGNYRDYFNIYNFIISNADLNSSLSIFSIIGLGLFNYTYYGKNSQCFFPELCSHLLQNLQDNRGLIYLNYPPVNFLQQHLLILNSIYSLLANNLGQASIETGPGLARGVRQTQPPQRYGFGGKKKLKTIKKKNLKRNKNFKKTKNHKKNYNKSKKIIKINKKHKTRKYIFHI